jgi:hypothetical protein
MSDIVFVLGMMRSGTTAINRWVRCLTGMTQAPGHQGRVLSPKHGSGPDGPPYTDARLEEQYALLDRVRADADNGIIATVSRWPRVVARYAADRGCPLLVVRREPAMIVFRRLEAGWGPLGGELGFEDSKQGGLRFCCWMQWVVLSRIATAEHAARVCVDEVSRCPQLLPDTLEGLGLELEKREFLTDEDREKARHVARYATSSRLTELRLRQDTIAAEGLPSAVWAWR